MTEQLLAYLLDDLSPADRATIETRLETDPAWRQEFERLRECLSGGNDPEDCGCAELAIAEPQPPADLVQRTCSLVESGEFSLRELMCDPPRTGHHWRLADFAVAAGVFLAIAAVTSPGLLQSREASRRAICANKLRALGTEFVAYAERNNRQLPPIALGQNAGMYAVALADQCGMDRELFAELLSCPATQLGEDVANGRVRLRVPTQADLLRAHGPVLIALRQRMGGSYAYRFGYFDPQGELHHVRFVGSDSMPVLADAPAVTQAFRSTPHGPCGQNVLYQSMSVRFVAGCQAPNGDELFLNLAGQHAAGLNRDDLVLGRSEFEPLGTIFPVGDE
ncbi:MAG: hypothetical protein KF847_00265 [Pirellulales bacterium]|nr:hypothetical protein [Pirellulales bacterium]